MMDTPICDFIDGYRAAQPLRLHMPGHKGKLFLGLEDRDITEIPGADVLYQADGIIRKSEENASRLFGTGSTFYSAEGSSLSIRAMLYLITLYAAGQGHAPRILAARNAHKVFITAAALLDISVQWLYPKGNSLLTCMVTPEALDSYLESCSKLPAAVYVTSPDYLGNLSDIRGLSAVCRRHGVLLAVDNAHGAYLHFLPEDRHPITLGADLCCDSAHKTLPVLTGGAYLHISPAAPGLLAEYAEQALALFASTSPSYLILQSLDRANRYLAEDFPQRLHTACKAWAKVRSALEDHGWETDGTEPLKLTLLTKGMGYTGTELGACLEAQGIYCEFADPDHLVMMVSPDFTPEEILRVQAALLALPRKAPIAEKPPALPHPELAVSPHRALFLPREHISAAVSCGRIMASASVSCPPAIPVVSCGERIDEAAVKAMAYYGIDAVTVIRE